MAHLVSRLRGLPHAIALIAQGLLLAVPGAINAWSGAALDAAASPIVLESTASHRASAAQSFSDASFDPQLVFYPQGACESELVEIETWDRHAEEWRPHDRHPRLQTDSCAVEDAGVLLNEIRVRCVDDSTRYKPSGWLVGANLGYSSPDDLCALLDGGRLPPLEIAITYPGAGDLVVAEGGVASIRGAVLSSVPKGAGATRSGLLSQSIARDIIVAVDASAANDSGPRAFARGALLDAQRDAVRSMLDALGPRLGHVRIGLVSHAADTARIEIPLTDDLGALHDALDAIRVRDPNTDPSYSAALALATTELDSRNGSPDSTRGTRAKVAYLLFDAGSPVAPIGGRAVDRSGSRSAAREWARRVETAHNAVRAGIELHVLALKRPASGSARGASPRTASRSLPSSWPALYAIPGSFTPIEAPAASADWLERVSLARVTRVRIDNLTTREVALDVALFPSGAFAGEVPVETGHNQLRITALTSDGRAGHIDLDFDFRPPTDADRALKVERARMRRVRAAREKSLEMTVEAP